MFGLPTKPPRKTSKNNRKTEIVRAATEIIARRGYFGFSIQEVAEVCGLTVAGVLHYCKTKDNLLVQVLEERDREELQALADWGYPTETPEGRAFSLEEICTILRLVVQRNSMQPNIVRLYSILRAEALYEEHPAFEYFRRRDAMFDMLAGPLEGKVAAPLSVARIIMSAMAGLEVLWLRFPDKVDLVGEWDRAIELILGVKPAQ